MALKPGVTRSEFIEIENILMYYKKQAIIIVITYDHLVCVNSIEELFLYLIRFGTFIISQVH